MFTLAIRHKKADRNPVTGIERLQEHNKRDRILSTEEVDRLLNASRTYLKPILMLDYYTGMRRGELLKLRWNQVDLKKGLIRLETTDTKTEEDRLVPLNEALTAVLKDAMSSYHKFSTAKCFIWNAEP
jgi:integrase